MEALGERDTKLLIEGGAVVSDLRLVRVQHKGKTYYQIEFKLNTHGSMREFILITTRNDPRRLVDLNRTVDFLEQLFPDNTEIKLILVN